MNTAVAAEHTVRTQAGRSPRVWPRPTVEGLIVNGPQRWPFYENEDERAAHREPAAEAG